MNEEELYTLLRAKLPLQVDYRVMVQFTQAFCDILVDGNEGRLFKLLMEIGIARDRARGIVRHGNVMKPQELLPCAKCGRPSLAGQKYCSSKCAPFANLVYQKKGKKK